MTRALDSSKAKNYLKKADDSLHMARLAIRERKYDNAVMSAVHSAINALDALTTSHLGKRASGAHTDVLSLVKGIFSGTEYALEHVHNPYAVCTGQDQPHALFFTKKRGFCKPMQLLPPSGFRP